MPFSHPAPPAPWSSPWGLACPQLPHQPADNPCVLFPGIFFPDHLFSVFSISQDSIPGQEHPRPGPPHVGAPPASPRWLHKGKPKISTGDHILFVASPSGWGRVTSILQIQSFVLVPNALLMLGTGPHTPLPPLSLYLLNITTSNPNPFPQVQVISTPAAAPHFFSHLIKVSAPCPHPWGPLTSPHTPQCPRGHPHHSPPAPIPTRDPLGAQKVTAVLLGSAGILAQPGARKAEENIEKKKKKSWS